MRVGELVQVLTGWIDVQYVLSSISMSSGGGWYGLFLARIECSTLSEPSSLKAHGVNFSTARRPCPLSDTGVSGEAPGGPPAAGLPLATTAAEEEAPVFM